MKIKDNKKLNRVLSKDFEDSTEDEYSVKDEIEDDNNSNCYPDSNNGDEHIEGGKNDESEVVLVEEEQVLDGEKDEDQQTKGDKPSKTRNQSDNVTRLVNVNKKVPTGKDGNKVKNKTTNVVKNKSPPANVVTDEETSIANDKDYVWEIERDRTREYYYSSTKKLNKVKGEIFDSIVNHRKAQDYEGELLILYTNGTRHWVYLYGIFETHSDDCITYICENNLTLEMMQFEMEKKLREEQKEKEKQRRMEERKNKMNQKRKGKNKKAKKNQDKEVNLVPSPVPIKTILVTKATILETPSKEEEIGAHVDLHQASGDEDDEVEQDEASEDKADEVEQHQASANEDATDDEDEEPFVCNDSRKHNVMALGINDDCKYCTNNYRFDGVTCAVCGALFVHKVFDYTPKLHFKPSWNKPMYCCGNAKEYCTYALCYGCRDDKAIEHEQERIAKDKLAKINNGN
jgi:hypothetical protein